MFHFNLLFPAKTRVLLRRHPFLSSLSGFNIFLFRRESCFHNTNISHSVSAFDQTKITILALSHTSIYMDVPKLVC